MCSRDAALGYGCTHRLYRSFATGSLWLQACKSSQASYFGVYGIILFMENRDGRVNSYKPVRLDDNNTGTYKPVRARGNTATQKSVSVDERTNTRTQSGTTTRMAPRNTTYSKSNTASPWSAQQDSPLSSPLARYLLLPLAAAAVLMLIGLLVSCVAGL